MQQDNSYIRISEATKVYKKTRQTFYNYIRKGLISTKKIQNKVYLSVRDIERVMSNYIGDVDHSNNSASNGNVNKVANEQISTKIAHLESSLLDLSQDTKFSLLNMQQTVKQELDLTTSRLEAQLANTHDYYTILKENLGRNTKKQSFVTGYILIVAVNTLIVYFLSL